ncbi:polysaccharide pyruvyl transferase family protein [Streptosporangium sp. NPDC087985]|uniref:polysaccharide pyruvyl transferase family protein n=1 Tax=Streptosporangium sp. NPDC087985 TaxID=3366196 RepID=UPI00380A9A91
MDKIRGPTIGLLGSYGGRNVGDEAILTSILSSIRQGRPDASTTVFSRCPDHTRIHHGNIEVVGWEGVSRESASQIMSRLDMLILGGGGILYDTEARRYLRLVRLAQEQNVPVFTYAVGAGPLSDRVDCMMVRETLTSSTVVTVRDEESRLVLEEAGVMSPITVTADPAFLLEQEEFSQELLHAEGVPEGVRLVGMSVREPGRAAEHLDVQGYHELLAHVGDFLIHRLDAYIVFVPMERDDIRHSHAVLSHMNAADRCRVLHGDYRPRQILGLVRHLDLVVGMRLHFLIFAALQGVPLLPLPYAGKVFDLAQQLGAPALRGVIREAAGPLLAEVDRVWDERPTHTERINSRTPALRIRAAATVGHFLSQLELVAPRTPVWDRTA